MKRILIFACIASLMVGSCGGPRDLTKTIKVPPEQAWDNFSHSSLQRFITDNPGSSVVVRDPNINRDGVSNDAPTSRVCSLIEAALMRRGFNPRDRRLFENSVAKLEDGSDYPKIREVTGTDLIFEVSSFRKEYYTVFEYHDVQGTHKFEIDMGRKKPTLYPRYILTGFSIEIKVILLSDNLIAGTYKYYQTPCTENGDCVVTFFDEKGLRYRATKANKEINADDESESARIERRSEQFDREVSDFINNVVILSMFAHMEGGKALERNVLERNSENGFDEEIVELMRTDVILVSKVNKEELSEAKLNEVIRIMTENFRQRGTSREYVKEILQKEIQEYEKKLAAPYSKKEAKQEYKASVKKAKEILDQRLKEEGREGKKDAKQEYDKSIKEAKETLDQRLKGKNRREDTGKVFATEAQDRELALSSPNSSAMVSSVSDLILQAIARESKKSEQYKNDEERFSNLKDKEQIVSYISSITTNVASFPDENNTMAVFYCKRAGGYDGALLMFLDGNCIGIGTRNKGLLTKIPTSTGIHTLSLRDKNKELLNIPVDYSFKTYYPFEWNNNNINLITVAADKGDNKNAILSPNSYDMSNSVSDLILQAITKESTKHEQYKTDEERFSQLKDKKQIFDYIASITTNVADSPERIENNVVFFCEGASGNEVVLLLFMDGRCIGVGTKNKGLLSQMPKISGIRTLSLWSNDKKEVVNMPINFDFKTYYPFEWERNTVKLKN
jgi:hypothetical protein